MERIEQLLREELRRTEARGTAPADVMLARVARVRRRRTATIAAAAGVAVVLAGAALIGPLGFGGRAPAGAEPELPPPVYSNELLRAVFTDKSHGYVLQRRCATTFPEGTAFVGGETPPTEHTCAAQLLATADGGRGWQPRPLPTDPGTPDKYRDPSGRSLAFWLDSPGTIAVAGNDMRYWTSTDGGVTWAESADPRDGGPAGTLGVVGPREQQVFLTPPPGGFPPEKEGANPVAAATDGSFWRACADRSCAEVTRNAGASWEWKFPRTGSEPVDWVATYDGQTVYASVGPAILRSTDGGAGWTEVARRVRSERSTVGVVMPDGDVVLTEGRDGRLFRLAGGTRLERLDNLPTTSAYLYRSGGWLVASPGQEQREGDANLGSIVSVSPDNGTTWQAIPPPPTP